MVEGVLCIRFNHLGLLRNIASNEYKRRCPALGIGSYVGGKKEEEPKISKVRNRKKRKSRFNSSGEGGDKKLQLGAWSMSFVHCLLWILKVRFSLST